MKQNEIRQEEGMTPVVDRNIRALLERRCAEEARSSWADKVAAAVTRFTGSMTFVMIHLVIYGSWIAINVGWVPWVPRFDPTLVMLAMAASVEAIFLSTFILITQQRMMVQSERRAELSLQINLLAEHEITRLIDMTREMAKRMDIKEAHRPDLDELSKDVAPEKVLERIDEQEKRFEEEAKRSV